MTSQSEAPWSSEDYDQALHPDEPMHTIVLEYRENEIDASFVNAMGLNNSKLERMWAVMLRKLHAERVRLYKRKETRNAA